MSHPNQGQHNWLTYKIRQRFLTQNAQHFRGVLYDLGCGEAPHRQFFLRHADKYVGVDWSSSIHETDADVIADLNEPLRIESGAADTVVSLMVIEHVLKPQVMISEAHRILVPGGVIVLATPFQWYVHEAPFDYQRFTPYGLRLLLSQAGFGEIQVEPAAGFFTMMVLKTNYFLKRMIRGPRPVRRLLYYSMVPLWFIGQYSVPWLGKMDRDWSLEAPAFWVVARKPARVGHGCSVATAGQER